MNQPARKRRGPITLFCESRRFRLAVIAVALLPVLYVAGFGPACWLASRERMSAPVGRAVCRVYAPLLSHVLLSDDSSWSVRALYWWSSVGSEGDVYDLSMYSE
jgi:hypothetical protein